MENLGSNNSLIEDIQNIEVPSTSHESDPFPVPADPFDGYVNITETDDKWTNGTDTSYHFDLNALLDYMGDNRWLVYLIVGIGLILVLATIILLIIWVMKHKKRVINQQSDPVLVNTYDQDVHWKRLCCACCNSKSKTRQEHLENRQNSSSNLEAYGRRDPLPAAAYSNPIGSSNFQKENDSEPIDDRNLAVYIDGISGIPNRVVTPPHFRELPPLRLNK
ncbi:unnamed protein product [Caenorhabditis bovis]|uniref:Uncharacterized protein n=1 Tax=Caenorhabditis bovis TaxID=2654633 RepID=A0A8S1E816_9PELO|nr:unnamed protein product [Caenorhabditis bovis]